jgi:formamidopyrimidine-DNA glycosylase
VPSIEFFLAASGAVDLEIGRAMNTEHERKHLAQADRHIAELKKAARDHLADDFRHQGIRQDHRKTGRVRQLPLLDREIVTGVGVTQHTDARIAVAPSGA